MVCVRPPPQAPAGAPHRRRSRKGTAHRPGRRPTPSPSRSGPGRGVKPADLLLPEVNNAPFKKNASVPGSATPRRPLPAPFRPGRAEDLHLSRCERYSGFDPRLTHLRLGPGVASSCPAKTFSRGWLQVGCLQASQGTAPGRNGQTFRRSSACSRQLQSDTRFFPAPRPGRP